MGWPVAPYRGRVDLEPVRVWYVAYGSNLCRDRLRAYLEGSAAPVQRAAESAAGSTGPRNPRYGAHRGCRDPSPPTADRWLEIAHPVTFRGRSRRWGGGVAFLGLAPEQGVSTGVRAWSLTAPQLLGIAAQEAGLGSDPPATILGRLCSPGDTAPIGGGWYDTLLRLDDIDGAAALTVTTSQDLPPEDPTPAYLATIARGRAEHAAGAEVGADEAPVGGSWA